MMEANAGISPASLPRITIGVMTRNYARYLPCALDSIIAQEMPDWEVVIADDASIDDTEAVVQPYLTDPRIRYVRHETPRGQAGNWQFCLEWGTASVVAVLHADDSYLPGTLRWAVDTLRLRPSIDLLYGNFYRMSNSDWPDLTHAKLAWHAESGEMTGADAFTYFSKVNHCLPSACFVRRSVLGRSGLPDAALRMLVDTEFTRRLAIASSLVAWTDKPLTLYRVHRGGVSEAAHKDGTLAEDLSALPALLKSNIIAKHLGQQIKPHLLKIALRRLQYGAAGTLFDLGVNRCLHGRAAEGVSLIQRSLRMAPNLILKPRRLIDLLLIATRNFRLLRLAHSARLAPN